MNLKTKAFGLVAGVALTLSAASGAMAGTQGETVSATLSGGQCSMTLSAEGDLGTWTYNGAAGVTAYEPGADTTVNFTGVLEEGNPSGCTVSIGFNGITNGSGAQIGADRFQGSVQNFGTGPVTAFTGQNVPNVHSGTYTGALTLNSVPDNIMPGSYNGPVTVTFSNTQ